MNAFVKDESTCEVLVSILSENGSSHAFEEARLEPNIGLVTLAVDRGRLEGWGSTLNSKVETTMMEGKKGSPCKVERKG